MIKKMTGETDDDESLKESWTNQWKKQKGIIEGSKISPRNPHDVPKISLKCLQGSIERTIEGSINLSENLKVYCIFPVHMNWCKVLGSCVGHQRLCNS